MKRTAHSESEPDSAAETRELAQLGQLLQERQRNLEEHEKGRPQPGPGKTNSDSYVELEIKPT